MNIKKETNDVAESEDAIGERVAQQQKIQIYPELNARYRSVLKWCIIGFVLLVLVIQQFSGYS